MLAGRAAGDAFVVLDAFALPVVGTETRVNAQAEANEYMIDFLETNKVREKRSEREREREERGRKRKGGKAGERLRGGRKNTLTFSHSSFLSFFTKKALGQAGEPRGLVPLAPGLRVLALRDRRRDAGWYFLFSLSIFFLFLRGLKLWDAACCSRQTGPSLAADQPLARGIPGTLTRHFPKSKHYQKKKKKTLQNTTDDPAAVQRALPRHRRRPAPHRRGGPCRAGRVQGLPSGLHAAPRKEARTFFDLGPPDDPSLEGRGFRSPRRPLLRARDRGLQVTARRRSAECSVEALLGGGARGQPRGVRHDGGAGRGRCRGRRGEAGRVLRGGRCGGARRR